VAAEGTCSVVPRAARPSREVGAWEGLFLRSVRAGAADRLVRTGPIAAPCPTVPADDVNNPNPPPVLSELQLERALQLLGHSGLPLPVGAPGSAVWLQGVIDSLVELSSRDALTGLANRRAFDLALAREIDRVARSGEPALLLALDIDHFKRVNDTWGHGAGDGVIKAVSTALMDSVRPMDLVARVGGEEFAIILPNCASSFGETVAERIRRRVERTPVAVAPGQQVSVSVSIGGAFAPQWVRSTPTLWIGRADAQLYRAKTQGRNLVQLEPTAVSVVSSEEKRLLFDSFHFQDNE
jgi:diguanylate cyclase